MFKKICLSSTIFVLFTAVFAIGPEISELNGKKLKWENHQGDYFIMFKSLIKNDNRTQCASNCKLGDDVKGVPQADVCVDSATGSTFKLIEGHVPVDAVVQAAYLVWTSALPSDKVPSGETDNSVTLSFKGDKGAVLSTDVTATDTPKTINDFMNFSFGAIEWINTNDKKGCSTDEECTANETYGPGYKCLNEKCSLHNLFYTYRADVTEFFKDILATDPQNKGITLRGEYTVSNMECTNDPSYLVSSVMVGGWAIVFVYTSAATGPKNIYIYDGFNSLRFEETSFSVEDLDIVEETQLKLSMISFEGDPGLVTEYTELFERATPETLSFSGGEEFQSNRWAYLMNECNPAKDQPFFFVEVFNSISSLYSYSWDDYKLECVGGTPDSPDLDLIEYGMDVDTFIVDSKKDYYSEHLKQGETTLHFKVSLNQDSIFTNLLVMSLDAKVEEEEQDDSDTSNDTDNTSQNDNSNPEVDNANEVPDDSADNGNLENDNNTKNDDENKKSDGCSILAI